jgi:hypothetical protein
VRAGEISGAQQKLSHDLAPGEPESSFEEVYPLFLGPHSLCAFASLRLSVHRQVPIQPRRKRAMRCRQREHRLRIGDRRLDLEPVPDDPGVGHEASNVPCAEPRHRRGIESPVRGPEGLPFLQDGEPGEAGLVDLQDQPLEQLGVAPQREAVFAVVIGAVPLVAGRDITVGGHGGGKR